MKVEELRMCIIKPFKVVASSLGSGESKAAALDRKSSNSFGLQVMSLRVVKEVVKFQS